MPVEPPGSRRRDGRPASPSATDHQPALEKLLTRSVSQRNGSHSAGADSHIAANTHHNIADHNFHQLGRLAFSPNMRFLGYCPYCHGKIRLVNKRTIESVLAPLG